MAQAAACHSSHASSRSSAVDGVAWRPASSQQSVSMAVPPCLGRHVSLWQPALPGGKVTPPPCAGRGWTPTWWSRWTRAPATPARSCLTTTWRRGRWGRAAPGLRGSRMRSWRAAWQPATRQDWPLAILRVVVPAQQLGWPPCAWAACARSRPCPPAAGAGGGRGAVRGGAAWAGRPILPCGPLRAQPGGAHAQLPPRAVCGRHGSCCAGIGAAGAGAAGTLV